MAFEAAKAYGMLKKADENRQKTEEIIAGLGWVRWSAIPEKIEPLLQEAGHQAAVDFFARMEFPAMRSQMTAHVAVQPAFNAVDHESADYARERAAEMVGKRMVGGVLIDNPDAKWAITRSTRNWLRQEIEDAFRNNVSIRDLELKIRDSEAFSRSRARMIARTEVGNIASKTKFWGSVRMEAQWKRWKLSADHHCCDLCDTFAAQGVVSIHHDYGGGIFHPLAHPDCWCAVTYYWRKPNA